MSSGTKESDETAILNSDEREMLLKMQQGEVEDLDLTDAARWKRYSRIRKRIRNAIYDFSLLYHNWGELNLDKVFDEKELEMQATMDGVEGTIATLYRGLSGTQIPFDSHLQGSIVQAELDMNDRLADVRFSVTARAIQNAVNVNQAAERVNPDEVDTLRIPEMRAVLEGLAHSDANISELVEEGLQNAQLERAADAEPDIKVRQWGDE